MAPWAACGIFIVKTYHKSITVTQDDDIANTASFLKRVERIKNILRGDHMKIRDAVLPKPDDSPKRRRPKV